jgi:hypothetical protein
VRGRDGPVHPGSQEWTRIPESRRTAFEARGADVHAPNAGSPSARPWRRQPWIGVQHRSWRDPIKRGLAELSVGGATRAR